MNITRWFDNVQHLPEVTKSAAILPLIKINTDVPVEQVCYHICLLIITRVLAKRETQARG